MTQDNDSYWLAKVGYVVQAVDERTLASWPLAAIGATTPAVAIGKYVSRIKITEKLMGSIKFRYRKLSSDEIKVCGVKRRWILFDPPLLENGARGEPLKKDA